VTRRCQVARAISGAFFIGLLAFGLILSACSVGPDYARPPVTTPAQYKEAGAASLAQSVDQMIKPKWWEMFGDTELNGLEEQVDVSNQNIAQAVANYRQALALVQSARAAYFPTVTIGVGVSRLQNSPTISPGEVKDTAPFTEHSMPIEVSWEVDVWGRIRRLVESTQANAQANEADLEAAKLSARSQLAQAYFLLRTLDAQKELLEATVVAYQKSVELTTNRYNSGVASRGDVLQAQTQLKSTQAQEIDITVQRAQVEHAIALLIGKAPAEVSVSVAALNAIPPVLPAGVPEEILKRRPDVAAAERLMASANAQIGVAVAAYYPDVSVNSSGGFESTSASKWFSWMGRFWSVGMGMTQTLFDGGLRGAQVDRARAAYDASVASYRETVLTGYQEIEDSLAAQRILDSEARTQDEAVEAAQQSLAVILNQYQAGIVSYLNVIVAQTIALSNQRTAVDILGRRMNAAVLLIKALGGGWQTT